MSRDVTHHHNRERGLSSCHHTSETASLREEDQGIESYGTYGENLNTFISCLYYNVYRNKYNLHFFKLQTLLVGFLCPSCCLHKLPLFGPFPGPCGMIPPFVPVWSNEGGAASSEHDWRSRDSCCEEKGSCRVQRSFKWRKLLSWRARVDQCGLILT